MVLLVVRSNKEVGTTQERSSSVRLPSTLLTISNSPTRNISQTCVVLRQNFLIKIKSAKTECWPFTN